MENILYCSTLCSPQTIKLIEGKYGICLSGITIQKFHRLIVDGLTRNGAKVDCATAIPITTQTNAVVINVKNDECNGVRFHYPLILNVPILRHLCLLLGTLFTMIKWRLSDRNNRIVICDVLNISISMGALIGRLFGLKLVGLMTDMPGLMMCSKKNILGWIVKRVNLWLLRRYNAYIFLTEAMNDVINTKHRPYIVMEGLVDSEMSLTHRTLPVAEKNIIYAGGLHERYGVKMLIDAFMQIEDSALRLSLYGTGPMAQSLHNYEKLDPRIHYYGLRPNTEIVEAELKAFLLVNPRPTHEEFTKYSFPSKNMEYMVSGTPLLTTALPGMPKDYYDKIFVCYEESVEGFVRVLKEILSLSDTEMAEKGALAKSFVLNNKNNVIQAKRILKMCYTREL